MWVKERTRYSVGDIFVDGWNVFEEENIEKGEITTKDVFVGEIKVKETEEEKYLGSWIIGKGNNLRTIKDRARKSIGIITKIMNILDETCFGTFYFEVGIILRNACSVLFGSEVWGNI